jgi:hypothetical protein
VSAAHDAHRDSYGLALAWLDGDLDRVAKLLEPYRIAGDELHLLVSVLDLVRLDRDEAGLRSLVSGLAIAGAGRRPE